MHIFAPINAYGDAVELTRLGADELYAGVIPAEWKDAYESVKPPNRRANEHSQVRSLSELEAIADHCADADVDLYVTLNAHFYSDRQADLIRDLVRELSTWDGIAGYIVADVHLIDALGPELGDAEILVSTGSTVFNGHTADFLASMGADGVHLPRHLTIDEIERIRERATGDLDLYAFVLNRNCMCIDGNCTLLHNPPIEHEAAERVPCFQTFETSRAGGETVAEEARLHPNARRDQEQACGICSMYRFAEMGLTGVKMVGRGLALEEKASQVEFLDRARAAIEAADSPTDYAERVRPLLDDLGMTCSLDTCYYPTVMAQ
ncbi:MAG: U32 family peptidase [Halanaeroarchaeum sp.]